MSGRSPEIVYTEEGMREGMQIEDANIPIDAKVALLDSTNASFGPNFLGDFPVEAVMKFLEKEHELWDAAGIKVTAVSVGDPMGWCHPVKIEEIFGRVKEQWPEITHFGAHLHNSRGMAIPSMYAAIKTLGPDDTLRVEGTIGGMGGCPYCGNGQATGMAATEDVMHMPWKEPIASSYRDRVEQGLPPFEVDGDWPWNEPFFPKPSAIQQ